MSFLETIFHDKLIPWTQRDFEKRLIVARPKMHQREMPFGVELSSKKITGKRVLVRTRDHGFERIICARWPKDGLHELFFPKLVCVLKGNADYIVGEYIISCCEGHFILVPPRTPNTVGGRSHLEGMNRQYGMCDLLQLELHRDYINCALCHSQGEAHRDVGKYIISHPRAIYLFNAFVEEALGQPKYTALCSHLLSSILIFSHREIQKQPLQTTSISPVRSTFANSQIEDYIKMHLRQSLTIEKMAQAMYMSPAQFTRMIRKQTGKSFVEVLTEYRIEEAKRLLRETEWSVAAIARHIGLKSSTYFIKLFGDKTGYSPNNYRQLKID